MTTDQKNRDRIERDSMGEMWVPADAYYAAQTARAVENFPISGLRFPRGFIRALGTIKAAAARANVTLGLLDPTLGEAIVQAATEVAAGHFDQEFVVDVFQTGSGTSTNMNANEVIANRALELLGYPRGDLNRIHPNDHVNLGQSTNDVFPSAIHLAALEAIAQQLRPALVSLHEQLNDKALAFAHIIKAGRTHLQDAVPLTLGQEFSGYASVIQHGIQRMDHASDQLVEVPLGGTALGTGLNTHPQFPELVLAEIQRTTGIRLRRADNPFEAMQNRDAAVATSGAVKTLAVGLLKMANDLRLLSSGPRTGLAEITLPAVQPGSSIMPGKVNPVIPEAVTMVAAQILGNDVTISLSGLNGNLDLNVMMPVIAYALLQSIEIAANAGRLLAERCIAGITVDAERCEHYAEMSAAVVTAIAPAVGYDTAAKLYKKAVAEGKTIREVLQAEGVLSPEQLAAVLDLRALSRGGRKT